MSIAVILGIIGSILTIVIMWMKGADMRERERVWNEFNAIEAAYRKALSIGDVTAVSNLSKQMQELRDKYKYLKG